VRFDILDRVEYDIEQAIQETYEKQINKFEIDMKGYFTIPV
jgi:hypothetical protein